MIRYGKVKKDKTRPGSFKKGVQTRTIAPNVISADIDAFEWLFATNHFAILNKQVYGTLSSRIEYDSNISKCLTGNGFAILILTNGTVNVIGDNRYGQIGVKIRELDTVKNWTTDPQVTDVVDGSCGNGITVLVRSDGRIYVAGRNDNKQLGLNDRLINGFQLHPKVRNILSAKCGKDVIFLLTEFGKVLYSGGINLSVRRHDTFLPLTLDNITPLDNVIDMSVSDSHALFLTSDRRLYGYGYNYFNQFGTSDRIVAGPPVSITSTSLSAKKVSCGNNWSMIMDTKGDVYIAGKLSGTTFGKFTKVKGVNLLK